MGKKKDARKVAAAVAAAQKPVRVPLEGDVDLGELGVVKPEVSIRFGWFGHRLRVNPGAGELELSDWLERAATVEVPDENSSLAESVEAMKMTKDLLRAMVHPDDFGVFWDLAKTNRQDTGDLMEVGMAIVAKVSGFPTTPPSDSSDGRSETEPTSAGVSSPLVAAALRQVPGRPDLQAAIFAAQQNAPV